MTYEDWVNMSSTDIVIYFAVSIIITAIVYLAYPIFLILKKTEISEQKVRKIAIWNSVVGFVIFVFLNGSAKIPVAFTWGFITYALLKKFCKPKTEEAKLRSSYGKLYDQLLVDSVELYTIKKALIAQTIDQKIAKQMQNGLMEKVEYEKGKKYVKKLCSFIEEANWKVFAKEIHLDERIASGEFNPNSKQPTTKSNKCNCILPTDSEFGQCCGTKIIDEQEKEIRMENVDNISSMTQEELVDMFIKSQVMATKDAYDANCKTQFGNEEDENFGLVPENPIYTLATKSVDGETEYLNNLRSSNGEKIKWKRRGSLEVECVNGKIDIYDIYLLSGEKYSTIYINMYGATTSRMVPKGFCTKDISLRNETNVKSVSAKKSSNEKKEVKKGIDEVILSMVSCICILLLSIDSFAWGDVDNAVSWLGVLLFYAIPSALFFVNRKKQKPYIKIILSCIMSLYVVFGGLLCDAEDPYDFSYEAVFFFYILLLSTIAIFIISVISLFKTKWNMDFYYKSMRYRVKCYKRVAKMKEYLDNGIITEEEFEKNKKEILKNIKF